MSERPGGQESEPGPSGRGSGGPSVDSPSGPAGGQERGATSERPDVPGATTGATRYEPPISPVAAPFWDATRERRLLLQWCNACRRPVWYPREVCPGCLGSTLEWRESQGRGVVYACTVEHKGQTRALEAPYVVALVDLDDGVRLLSNVVGRPPEQVGVGDRVRVTWEPLSDGRNLPLFAPGG